ncbi:unnamed protein product [Clonostachys rosea]|uniref:Uncharacterized protein n=1 Tax=Bionectria ochroleuca TaxID=29856 RepID=A0ABY6UJM4_BIOOC|nr:unnamed protein product [Clonostachys rosea]
MKFATSVTAAAILFSGIAQARKDLGYKFNGMHVNNLPFPPPKKRSPGPHYCKVEPWSDRWETVSGVRDGYCEGLGDDGSNIECWRDNQCPIDAIDGLRFPCTWHNIHEAYASCDGRDFYTGHDSPSPEPQPAPGKGGKPARKTNARPKSKSSKRAAAKKYGSGGSKPRPATAKDKERISKARSKANKKSAPAKKPGLAKKPSPAKKAGPAVKAKAPSKPKAPTKAQIPPKPKRR